MELKVVWYRVRETFSEYLRPPPPPPTRATYIEMKPLSQPNKVVRVGSLREKYHAAELCLSNITCSIGPPSAFAGPHTALP